MKIAIIGYGKMGKIIEQVAQQRGHQIIARIAHSEERSQEALAEAEVAIEFTQPEAALDNLLFCFAQKIPVVCGTTGWLKDYPQAVEKCREAESALLYASNFSLGVNLFFALNRQLAQLIQSYPAYRASIEEIHHLEKKDAPSGTAISLAEGLIDAHSGYQSWHLGEAQDPASLPIEAQRLPDVPGIHEVQYQSNQDKISIRHEAFDREGFALGAVMAAEYLQGKTGVYSMQDLLKSHQ